MAASTVAVVTTGGIDQAAELRPLTDLDREVLTFERTRWKYAGAKEQEVRRRWDMSGVRHAQLLDFLLDHPEAEVFDSQVVHRLRRLRDARRWQRCTDPQSQL